MRFAIAFFESTRRAIFVGALGTPLLSLAAGPYGLVSSFSREAGICKRIAAQASSLAGCRAYDVSCPGKTGNDVQNGPLEANDSLSFNAYGYTEIQILRKKSAPPEDSTLAPAGDAQADELAQTLPEGVALLYLSSFGGDRNPRLMETWKVNSTRLEELLDEPLPPFNPNDRQYNFQRNAEKLAAVISDGERLSGEWSPVVVIDGRPYIVERECSGHWAYGGYYVCNKILKLTFKRIDATGKSIPYCQFSLPPRKKVGGSVRK